MEIAFSMRRNLAEIARRRFSETARSGPCHREAGRYGTDLGAVAVVGRRLAHDVAERPAEGAQAGETNVEADVRYATVRLAQQEHRALDSPPLQVAVRRLAEGVPKRADEVGLGDQRDPRQR